MTEAIQTQDDAEVCRAATPEEIELHEWIQETRRKTPTVLADGLKQLVALDSVLLGGSVAVLNMLQVWAFVKAGFFLLLLTSLAAALLGAMPVTSSILYLEDAQEAQEKEGSWRLRCLRWSGVLLFLSFAFLAFGLLPALFGYGPPASVTPAAPARP